ELERSIDRSLRAGRIAGIGLECRDVRFRTRNLLESRDPAAGDEHPSMPPCKSASGRPADTGAAARHDHDQVFDVHLWLPIEICRGRLMRARRHALGVSPTILRNSLVKCD